MDVLQGAIVDLAGSLFDRFFEQPCDGAKQLLAIKDKDKIANSPNIHKRDVCTDAFGTGWSSNTCTPGNTLCCVKDNASMPTCSQHLGIGWCCTAEGGCYADLNSSCGQPGAVSCTELGAGVDEACCPRYTTCAKGYNATETFVRCNIRASLLSEIAETSTALSGASTRAGASSATSSVASSSSSSSSNSASTSAYLSTSTSTTQSASAVSASSAPSTIITPTPDVPLKAKPSENALSSSSTSAPTPQTSGILLTTGEIIGIVVASAGGVLFLVALSWLLRRRNRSRRRKFAMPSTPMSPSFKGSSKRTSPIMLQAQHGFSELSGHADPVELQTSGWSRRQVGTKKHVSVAGTYELGSEDPVQGLEIRIK